MRTIRDPPARSSARKVDWQQMLIDAVSKPGVIASAYSAFWNYSAGNQLLAYFQCLFRNLDPGPIHTFRGWLQVGRHVRKGEKAITLVMPVTVKRKRHETASVDEGAIEEAADPLDPHVRFTKFVERPFWFVLAQTDGEPYVPVSIPQWDERLALHTLGITREPFRHLDGNCQGYAHGRSVAVSPLAFLPHRTLFHELAHVVLGHCAESLSMSDDDAATPRDLREVEAECVAMLCSSSLGMPGEDYSRGYIQHWMKSGEIPERSVHRIFKAADTILKSGLPRPAAGESESPESESTES